MELPEVGISLGGNLLLGILFLVLASVSTAFFYRTTVPPTPRRMRIFLASLRGLALALLLLLLFEPLLKFILRREQSPLLAVLLDDSESMAIKDRGGSRAAQVRAMLERNPFGEIPATIVYYRFSDRLSPTPLTNPDSLTFRGETTDLAAALGDVARMSEQGNIKAAVLVTDGEYTVGKNPLAVAENVGIPIFSVGVGDTTDQRDILVARVRANKIVYSGTRVPVDVSIRNGGYTKGTVEVTLSHAGAVVDRRLLQLSAGTREHTLSLSYEPKEEGVQKYTLSVSPLPGELTERNNSATFFVNVLKSKLRILLLGGAPSPDVSVVAQTLSEEEHFSVHTLVQRSAGDYYGGGFVSAALDSADCLVLVGYPSVASPSAHVQMVHDAGLQKKKPLLFIASRTLDFNKLGILESLLPFTWSAASAGEVQVFPHIPEKAKTHTLVSLGERVSSDSWSQLPPVFKTTTTFRAKAEADVLAAVKIQAVVLNEPLILIRNVARLRSFGMTGHGIWRWRLLAQGNPQTDQLLRLLLTNAVRWLTAPDEGKRVRVTPTKEIYAGTEPVEFTGEVYDEQLRPLDDAELTVSINSKDAASRSESVLRSIGSGRYEGSVGGLGPGDYAFSATATAHGTEVGKDQGRFSVGQLNIEFLETRMNKSLLEQLAFRTGGLYADIASVPLLVDSLRSRTLFTPREIVSAHEVEVWNWQYIGGLIILLLATEWVVRKRNGML